MRREFQPAIRPQVRLGHNDTAVCLQSLNGVEKSHVSARGTPASTPVRKHGRVVMAWSRNLSLVVIHERSVALSAGFLFRLVQVASCLQLLFCGSPWVVASEVSQCRPPFNGVVILCHCSPDGQGQWRQFSTDNDTVNTAIDAKQTS